MQMREFSIGRKIKRRRFYGKHSIDERYRSSMATENIAEYIKHLNEIDKETNYIHSSLEEYIKSVEHEKPQLQRLEGDLIAPENSRTHTSMASTRVYQKKRNREEQNLVERYVEPISSMGVDFWS